MFPGSNAGVEEALVGVNIPHSRQYRLIKQRGFDGQAPAAEERGEIFCRNGERFRSRGDEFPAISQIAEFEAAETAWIHEAQFLSAGQTQPRMGVVSYVGVRSGYEQPASHAEVDNPLRVGRLGLRNP